MTQPHPPGATLHLGGNAWAHPNLTDRLVPIDTITPYPGNPRRGDQDAITASIRDHGLYTGVVTQATTGHILVGNHRRHALIDLGAEMIPADPIDVDDTRAAAIVARDNHTADLGTYDDRALLDLLTRDEAVLALSGYDDEDLRDILRAVENHDFVLSLADLPPGTLLTDASAPIDTEGDVERVTVTVDAGQKQALYALLAKQAWVRDVADAHTRRTTA